jgi:hypothetical protein
MRSHWIVAAILTVFPAASSFAQQSPLDMRKQVEQMTATFSERYNKQDAAGLATMFVKDAVRVSSTDGAAVPDRKRSRRASRHSSSSGSII